MGKQTGKDKLRQQTIEVADQAWVIKEDDPYRGRKGLVLEINSGRCLVRFKDGTDKVFRPSDIKKKEA